MSDLHAPREPIMTVVFDAYGTLFDVHSAVARAGTELGPDAARVSALWRTKQLEYTWVLSLADRYQDFWTLTQAALDYALATVPAAPKGVREELLDAYRTLDAYQDVALTLASLRSHGLRTAILSNGTPDMLADAIAGAGLKTAFDAVWSVDGLRVFKTAPATYALVTDGFRFAPRRIMFVSSNRWDIAGAAAFGMRTAWLNRTNAPDEYAALPPNHMIGGLAELARVLT